MGIVLNILYDDRRFEKWDPLMEELQNQGINNFVVWPPVPRDNIVESINASHKAIVKHAKEAGLKEAWIAEDDLFFKSPRGFEYFLKNKPDDFDVYIGGTYLFHDPEKWQAPLVKVKEWVGNQLIVVHEKYYDRFLSVPDNAHVDMAQSGLGDFYVCFPMIAFQRPGFSHNHKTVVNYNDSVPKRCIYQ